MEQAPANKKDSYTTPEVSILIKLSESLFIAII